MNGMELAEMLRNYRSYRYAVNNGVAPFVEEDMLGMPMNMEFGSRIPKRTGSRGTTLLGREQYNDTVSAMRALDGAIEDVLNDHERDVIRLKYTERNTYTLSVVANKIHVHQNTVTGVHKSALKKLTKALVFVEVPPIHNLDNLVKYDSDLFVSNM